MLYRGLKTKERGGGSGLERLKIPRKDENRFPVRSLSRFREDSMHRDRVTGVAVLESFHDRLIAGPGSFRSGRVDWNDNLRG